MLIIKDIIRWFLCGCKRTSLCQIFQHGMSLHKRILIIATKLEAKVLRYMDCLIVVPYWMN
jgi:hypothetical protein